jgi:hypothetical protein
MLEINLFIKIFYTAVKDIQIEIIFLQEFYIQIRHIITFFIIDHYKEKFNFKAWQPSLAALL